MILAALLLGAALVVGVCALFWNTIHDFLKRAAERVKAAVKGVYYAAKVLSKKIREGIQEITKHYSRVEDHWQETTVVKKELISVDELPDSVRTAHIGVEIDISDELAMQLKQSN